MTHTAALQSRIEKFKGSTVEVEATREKLFHDLANQMEAVRLPAG